MIFRAAHDATGAIRRVWGSSLESGLNISDVPANWTVRPALVMLRPDFDWWNGTEWAPRPAPPAPPALVAGVAATWAGLPVGAVVTVTDPATGVVAGSGEADEAGDLSLTLPAGPWRITVNEVFPAVAASFDIEVAPE